MREPDFTVSAGPTMASPRVLAALGSPITYHYDPAFLEAFRDEHDEIELVTVVHSETPSGTLNDVSAIGPIARAHGALTLVDCVSSLGGIPFDADGWQVPVHAVRRGRPRRRGRVRRAARGGARRVDRSPRARGAGMSGRRQADGP